MDLLLPDGNGIDATVRILQHRPGGDACRRPWYVLKDTDPDLVVDALRTIAGGGHVLGPKVAPTLLTQSPAAAALPAPFDKLIARERDILIGLASGYSNARIARQLGLSEKTVRNQMSAVFTKLGVADRVQAALRARDAGIG